LKRKSTWLELVAVALVAVIGAFAFGAFSPSASFAPAAEGQTAQVEEEGAGPAEPDDEYFLLSRAGPGKVLNEAAAKRARAQANAVAAATAAENAALPAQAPRQLRGQWEPNGPTNIGGRIVDLVVDIDDPNTVYVATASGGVWKSSDGVVNMEYIWDDNFPQGTGGIAMGSDGRLWVGTGEHNPGGGSITFPGDGIYVSDDRGETWRNVGLRNSGTTGRLWVDPSNPNRIFAAMSGSLFSPGGERGIYRSDTGGANWKLILAPETEFTGGIDLAIHPSNPNRVYAAMWDHHRTPVFRAYGGAGSGVFRSDDGGDTWTRLENVQTPTPGDTTGLVSHPSLGRPGVAIAPNNPNRVYVVTGTATGGNKGFYVSDDGGDTFNTSAQYPGSQGGFQWWFGRIWVDPVDQNHLFVAGVSMRRSANAGSNWSNVPGLHADQHALEFATDVPGLVYVGNDGGTYDSTNNGVSGFAQAQYEVYTQFYSIDVAETDPRRVTGGTQDNGCLRSWNYPDNPGDPDNWNSFGCGDGEYTIMDPVDPGIYYGCSQYGSCIRRYDGPAPAPVTNATISSGTFGTRRNWFTPIVLDPNDPTIIYYGSNVVNKSTNRGSSWTAISPTASDQYLTGLPATDPVYTNWGTITTISVAKTAPDTLFIGTDNGRVWGTTDGGANWTWYNNHGLPDAWVSRVAIDPTNDKVVYATFSGYRSGDNAAHVFKTTDGGATWKDVSGNLPNAPVNDVVVDTKNSTVYVATDVGIFFLKNGRSNWKTAGVGMPVVPSLDIRLHEPTNTLYASTFGRSTFKLDLSK